jgi:hypothetical protein
MCVFTTNMITSPVTSVRALLTSHPIRAKSFGFTWRTFFGSTS